MPPKFAAAAASHATILVVGILLGYVIFSFTSTRSSDLPPGSEADPTYQDTLVSLNYQPEERIKFIIDSVRRSRLGEHLRKISRSPHPAGSAQNERYLVDYISEQFTSYGLADVAEDPYNVLLSFPNSSAPNEVQLVDSISGEVSRRFLNVETEEDVTPPYLAYTPPGIATGEAVFVNEGKQSDMEALEGLKVAVKDKICVIRLSGAISPASALQNCEGLGAVAAVFYPDPQVVALGAAEKGVYPNSSWLDGSSLPRYTMVGPFGDPMTLGYPSTDGISTPGMTLVPGIPAQQIGYDDAYTILSMMDGQALPDGWTTGFREATGGLGPGFGPSDSNKYLRVSSNNYYLVETIKNVIGVIHGFEEPDSYVVVGAHRDSWIYGAVDSGTGTSVLLETARLLGQLATDGWRPRRTIIFASWSGKEFGDIGSTELVEGHLSGLREQGVSYINIDSCVSGDEFSASSSPIFRDLLHSVTKEVTFDQSKNVYDEWQLQNPERISPRVHHPSGDGDNAPFQFLALVPTLQMQFKFEYNGTTLPHSPSHHTVHDTIEYFETYIDPNYRKMKTIATLYSIVALTMVDSPVLPYDVVGMWDGIREAYDQLDIQGVFRELAEQETTQITNAYLRAQLDDLASSTLTLFSLMRNTTSLPPQRVIQLNQCLSRIGRILTKGQGIIPARPFTHNIIFAPSLFESHNVLGFPAIQDYMYLIKRTADESTKALYFEAVATALSDLLLVFRQLTKNFDQCAQFLR